VNPPTGALLTACIAALALGTAAAQTFEHPEQAPPPTHQGQPAPSHTQAPPPPTRPQSQPYPAHPQGQPYPSGAAAATPHYSTPTVRTNTSHYYPPHGASLSAPPPAPVVVSHPSGRYYYSGGVWYAPRGPSYVVVAAPVGVFVPVLPPYYSTVWVSGAPYYYANQTYYSWSPQQNSYQVVAPPQGDGIPGPENQDQDQGQDQAQGQDQGQNAAPDAAAAGQAAPPPANDGLYVYPQNGQSDQQQATDRYECHQWANVQTGFDPTQTNGGTRGNPDDYQRAMKACLEGRGYSVR
jgi:hypothetical protein